MCESSKALRNGANSLNLRPAPQLSASVGRRSISNRVQHQGVCEAIKSQLQNSADLRGCLIRASAPEGIVMVLALCAEANQATWSQLESER